MFQSLVRQYFRWHGVDIINEGDGCRLAFDSGNSWTISVADPTLWRDIAIRGSIAFGEGFVDGRWDLPPEDLEPLLRAFGHHGLSRPLPHHSALTGILQRLRRPGRAASPTQSHSNSSHHYDLGNELFAAFLDEDMTYSCGFFDSPDWTLEEAQRRKIEVTLDRLQLFDQATVLDIGCGWGSLAVAASRRGAQVTGINLAREQVDLARRRVAEAQSSAEILLADYREFARERAGTFDRIVSVGMIEHVGKRRHKTFFKCVRRLLKPGGIAVVHSIVDWPFRVTDPWLERYIFPGGYVPRTTHLVDKANAAGLRPVAGPYRHDGVNYATTLAHWRKRFLTNYDSLNQGRYPERFKRMWLLYLAGCEAAFRTLGLHNAQVVYRRQE